MRTHQDGLVETGPSSFSGHKRAVFLCHLVCRLAYLQWLLGFPATGLADTGANLIAKLETGGYVLLMEHASASPANQSPPSFPAVDCNRLHVLSEQGQLDARQVKEYFLRHGITVGRVLSSHDCRCIETAGIAFGYAQPWSIIDDVASDDTSSAIEKRTALREAIRRWSSRQNLVLISHKSNFLQAIGTYPAGSQVLVMEPLGDSGFRELGRLNID